MPGIAGVFAPSSGEKHARLVRKMTAVMRHHHGDLHGLAAEPALGLHVGWVARAGSMAAIQCEASNASVPRRIVFTGECFDTPGGRLLDLMTACESAPDTFIAGLNGLFSGLLIDRPRQEALLFNDRYGSERLYVHEHDGCVYFASEAKALLAVLPSLRAFDEEGVADFLTFGSVLGGRTLFRGLKQLPGGSLWRFRPGQPLHRGRYFMPAQWESAETLSATDFEQAFVDTFRKVLPAYVSAPKQIGISLTAGLDTRMIMACLSRQSPAPVTYTYAPERGETLDVSIARQVAGLCGLSHATLRVPPSFLPEFARHVDRTVFITDGCAGLLGSHELVLSEQADALSPVRLTGNFGSEVLRSMSTFKPVVLDAGLVEGDWAAPMKAALGRVAQHRVHPVTHAAFEEIPWHLSGTLLAARSQLAVRTPYLDNAIVELAYRAPAQLRHSAHPSLRVVHDNRPDLARVATDRGISWQGQGWRSLPRRVFCEITFKLDYWHKEGLPSALSPAEPLFGLLDAAGLLGLHKFLPYRRWFRNELAPYLAGVTGEARRRRLPFWNSRFLETVVNDHVCGRHNRLRELHAIVTLEAVDRLLISAAAHADAGLIPA